MCDVPDINIPIIGDVIDAIVDKMDTVCFVLKFQLIEWVVQMITLDVLKKVILNGRRSLQTMSMDASVELGVGSWR